MNTVKHIPNYNFLSDSFFFNNSYSVLNAYNNFNLLKITTHNVRSFKQNIKQQQIINQAILLNVDILGVCETNVTTLETFFIHKHNDSAYKYFFNSSL